MGRGDVISRMQQGFRSSATPALGAAARQPGAAPRRALLGAQPVGSRLAARLARPLLVSLTLAAAPLAAAAAGAAGAASEAAGIAAPPVAAPAAALPASTASAPAPPVSSAPSSPAAAGALSGGAPAPKSYSDGHRSRRASPPPGASGATPGPGPGSPASARAAGAAPGGKAAAAGDRPDRPEPWEGTPFAADPAAVARAAARFEGHEGEPVVVLFSDQRYAIDAAGRETHTQRLVYRILTAGADGSWSTVERSWAPGRQARPEVRARVITPDGVAHQLEPSMLTESGEVQEGPDMFGDGRVLRGPLPATGPGAVVEQEVTVRDTAPFFDAGVVEVAEVAASVSVHHARVVVEAPAATPLRWAARLLPGTPSREEWLGGSPGGPAAGDGLRRLTFDYRDLGAEDEVEPGLPPEMPRSAHLAFSTGRSWNDIARRYSEIVDEAIRGADLAPLIRAAGGPAASQLETMNRLLARLGEIRYTGVELGQGGIVPRPPAETLRRKFGDCKDKAVLLIAALRALEIPAYAALLDAGDDQEDVEQGLPGFGGFNHAIVVVPGTPSIWIDPTDRFARAGELPTDDQGRLALIASPTAAGLVRIPEAEAAENRAVKVREYFLADLGSARAVETDDYWGAAERELRAFYTNEDPEQLRDAVADYVRKEYLAKEVTSYDHGNPLDLSRPFRLRFETRDTRRAVTDETGAAVSIQPGALFDQLPDEIAVQTRDKPAKPRLADYYFSRPFTAEAIYRVVPAPGFAPQPLPGNRVRRLGTATLAEEYAEGKGGVVTATLRLETGKRRIAAAELEQLRVAVAEVAAAKPTVLRFSHVGEADLAAGRVREAIAEFQREAAAAPKQALPRCRLARALLAGGMGEAARQEAERATRLEPRSAIAWRTLGWVLQHDALGRRFAAGYDRAGAIAAYRKAKGLDAAGERARAELAILLEHDSNGRRYAGGVELAAAIAEYQALRTELKNRSLDDNLLVALLHAGRFAEVQALTAELDDTPERDALRLAAIAATAGAEAAVREAERRPANAAAQAQALEAAAQELVALRRYDAAAALLARAARQAHDAAALLARADALRRARRHEEVPLPAGDPVSAAERYLLASLADPPAPDRRLEMLSRGLGESFSAAARRELVEAPRRGAGPATRDDGLSADVRQDLALAAWRTAAQGDAATGYRVEVSSAVGESPARTALFVVPEGGEPRIAGLGDTPETLGFEALRRLRGRDLAGARRWLDWAREEVQVAAEARRPAAGQLTAAEAGAAAAAALGGVAPDAEEVPASPFLALWSPRVHAAPPDVSPAAGAGTAPGVSPAAAPGSPDAAQADDLEDTRCAAASLAATATGSAAAAAGEAVVATLRACRDRAGSAAGVPLGPGAGHGAGALAGETTTAAPAASSAAAARNTVAGGGTAGARRLALDVALAQALSGLGRFQELLGVARALAAERPDSGAAFALQATALAGLARWADLAALADQRLQARPDDAGALRVAARAAARRGDLETAAASLRRVVASGRERAADLNELAWLALVRGRSDDQAVEDAQRAAELSGYRDAAALHTLAALYAERGRAAESYRIVVQAIEARPVEAAGAAAPAAADWYVFGQLAETYGLPEEARRLYARVRPGKLDEIDPLSAWRLAQARLAALGAVKEAAAAGKPGHGGR
jgi:transglutaminase-like putative cysteine protease